jgi:hypothetical protein
MTTTTVDHLTAAIEELSLADQLLLLERLAQRIRVRTAPALVDDDAALDALAADPNVQRELRRINEEFAVADADGLTSH